jgi:hypothetical protein
VRPKAGSQSAKVSAEFRTIIAICGAVVVTASVAGVPGMTEFGLIEHCGANCGDGETEQTRETASVKPFNDVIVITEDPLSPGELIVSEPGFEVIAKSTVGVSSKTAPQPIGCPFGL